MHRREYKKKDSDIAIESASALIGDVKSINIDTEWPVLVEKLYSERVEIRIGSMKSMNKILTVKYFGEEIQYYINNTVLGLVQILTHYISQEEFTEALTVLCNLALTTFEEFETSSSVILNELMPQLKNFQEDQSFSFFAIAFIVGLTVSHEDICLNVINKFIDLILNKNTRSNLSGKMISNCIYGITLLTSTFSDHVVATEIYDKLISLIDLGLTSQKFKVLEQVIVLIGIVYEALSKYEKTLEESDSNSQIGRLFMLNYRSKINNIGNNVSKKENKKKLNSMANDLIDTFDEDVEETLRLVKQQVTIVGRRNGFILNAIRSITSFNFHNVMSNNPKVQEMLGYELMEQKVAIRKQKENKHETQQNRTLAAKERKMEIAKKRRQKESANELID